MGKDLFRFWVTKYGVIPMGTPGDAFILDTYCNRENEQYYSGYACAAWVIARENLDYLKGSISW
jgi:hypothetical protein